MRRIAFSALTTTFLWAQAPAKPDNRAELVLQRHVKARGGLPKLQALKTLRVTGWQLLLPQEVGIPWRMEQARPNKFREEITVQGMVEVHTFNGIEGWIRIPWARDKEAKALTPEQLEALKENDFDDPWIVALDHPGDLQFMGNSLFNRIPVYVVLKRLGPGDDLVGNFDQESGLEVMRERVHRELGNEVKVRTELEDWHTVSGLAFPFMITHRAMGRGRRQKIQVTSVEVDPLLPEARFGKP